VVTYWAIRLDAFRSIGASRIVQRAAQAPSQVGLGVLGLPGGLLVGDIVGRGVSAGYLAQRLSRLPRSRGHRRPSLEETARLARRYRRFPLYSTGAGLANTATTQLPFILLAVLYSRSVTGTYAVAEAVVGVPVVVLSASIAQVYTKWAAEAWRDSPAALKRAYLRTLKHLAMLGLAPLAAFVLLAPLVLPTFLGHGWIAAGGYARWIAIAYYGQFLIQPLSPTLAVMERQPLQLALDLSTLVLSGGALVAARFAGWSPTSAIALYCVASLLCSSMYIVVAFEALRAAGEAQRSSSATAP
jgi:O-antigen/teichoic acid export membrane protein